MIHFLAPRGQEWGIGEYLETDGRALAHRFSVSSYQDVLGRRTVPSGTYILSALDQLTPHGLRLVGELVHRLRTGPEARVLNSVERTLQRFDLLEELHRQGLNRHAVCRATDDLRDLRFPVFVREEHFHTGPLSGLLHSIAELDQELARNVVRGHRLGELLVVEYCDTADEAGRYRKYAAFIIGDTIIPHFMDRGLDWSLKHEASELTAETLGEQLAYVEENPHQVALRRRFALAGVQFGRMDYSVKDGAVETWEINLNPTFERYPPLPPELDRIRQQARDVFDQRVRAAFEALDVGGLALPPISVLPRRKALVGSRRVVRQRPRRRVRAAMGEITHAIRPLLLGLVRKLAPLVLRVAGRHHARRRGRRGHRADSPRRKVRVAP